MEEIWKDIEGFEGEYMISNLGRVKSLKSNIILRQFEYRGGYLEVHLRKPKIKVHKKVHRLVAEAFLTNPNHYKEVNHKDENKKNNMVNNLEWCSRSYNNTYNNRHFKAGKGHWKAVKQYDKNNHFIAHYESQTAASLATGVKQGSIADCIRGHIKSAGGYIWTSIS
jgi:hypothetical protein